MKFSIFLFFIFISQGFIITTAVTNNFLGLNQANSNLELFDPNPFEFLNTPSASQDFKINKQKATNPNINQNSLSSSLKCQICYEVYNNKFDFQIMIEQQNKCQYFESKFSISKDTCVYLSKNIAYKFFDNGGDTYFDRDLAQKIKNCRNPDSILENKQHALICQKTKGKVCDILLGNNNQECENNDISNSNEGTASSLKIDEKKESAISNSFMEVNTNISEVRLPYDQIFINFFFDFFN